MTKDIEAAIILIIDEIIGWRKMPPGSDVPVDAVIHRLEVLIDNVEEIPCHTINGS